MHTARRDEQTFEIIGAAMEVHRVLGHGFLEAVYQEALAIEFAARGIPFVREQGIPVVYKDVRLLTHYRADFVCYEAIIAEVKALGQIGGVEDSQIINYLKATGIQRGLLLNFGAPKLEYKRRVLNYFPPSDADGGS
jgi:GxxExxY protein